MFSKRLCLRVPYSERPPSQRHHDANGLNPFVPVHLPRGLWAVLNVGAAALFGFVAYRHR
jgi:hypothetical protein